MLLPTPNWFKIYNNWNYCYTHGCDVHNMHTNATCENLVYRHNLGTTQNNMIGGSMKGQYQDVLPTYGNQCSWRCWAIVLNTIDYNPKRLYSNFNSFHTDNFPSFPWPCSLLYLFILLKSVLCVPGLATKTTKRGIQRTVFLIFFATIHSFYSRYYILEYVQSY